MASIAAPTLSSLAMATTKIDANSNDIEKKEIKTTTNEIETKPTIPLNKPNELNLPTGTLPVPSLNAGVNNISLSSTDAAYVDEFYRKISEYYRGIFSNIDIKDPNISADVLNYYQLIRQFYEQTMAINIQRNTALGITSLAADPTKLDTSVLNATIPPQLNSVPTLTAPTTNSTIDLTIKNPPANDSFNNIKAPNTFQNNINIGTTNGDETSKENLIKMNDTGDVAENKVTIISAGVSINVSSLNSNSLKISCKTTPPKKRYSVYNHTEDATPATTPKSMLATPINLNRKFENLNVDALVAAKRKRENGTDDTPPLTKSNFTMEALKQFESNKSSPLTNTETSSSITDIIPITSTYLQLMRSMGFSEEDALKFDNLVSLFHSYLFLFFFLFKNKLFTFNLMMLESTCCDSIPSLARFFINCFRIIFFSYFINCSGWLFQLYKTNHEPNPTFLLLLFLEETATNFFFLSCWFKIMLM